MNVATAINTDIAESTSVMTIKDWATPAKAYMAVAQSFTHSLYNLFRSYNKRDRQKFFRVRRREIKIIRELLSLAGVYAVADSLKNPTDQDKLLSMKTIATEASYIEEMLHSLESFKS